MITIFKASIALYVFILSAHCEHDENNTSCVVQYLQQKNLLNSTLFPLKKISPSDHFKSSSCGKLITKKLYEIIKISIEKSFAKLQYETDDVGKLKECLENEFIRHNLGEKFLKFQIYEDHQFYHQQSVYLHKIVDSFVSNIERDCSKRVEKQSIKLFDALALNDSIVIHPARKLFNNHADSYPCMMEMANEFLTTDDNATFNDNFTSAKFIHTQQNETFESCGNLFKQLQEIFEDEWHILRKFEEDDEAQRCFLKILEHSKDIDMKIKTIISGEMREFTDFETDMSFKNKFIEHNKFLHDQSYQCIIKEFAKF